MGTFTFSVQHPVDHFFDSELQTSGKRTSWLVDDYFKTGKRVEPGLIKKLLNIMYNGRIFTLLQQAGFTITNLKEATPDQTYVQSEEEYERRLRIPLFLILLPKIKRR